MKKGWIPEIGSKERAKVGMRSNSDARHWTKIKPPDFKSLRWDFILWGDSCNNLCCGRQRTHKKED